MLTDNWKAHFWVFFGFSGFFFCFFFFCCFLGGGGFKGQVRWPEGPPHLALNPPYLFFLFFLSLFLIEKPCFPPKKGIFCFFFECLPLFLLSLFWPPPFSLSLSLSLSFFFLPSFLSFFFAFFWFLVFVSFFSFYFFFAFASWKNNIKVFNYRVFVHQSFLIFVGFLSSFFFQIPFSLSLPFSSF